MADSGPDRLRKLIQTAQSRSATGFFRVKQPATDGLLLIRKGRVVSAAIRVGDEPWSGTGEGLVTAGLVAPEALTSIDVGADPKTALWQLAERHGISPSVLESEIRHWVEARVAQIMEWTEAEVGFYRLPAPGSVKPEDPVACLLRVSHSVGWTLDELHGPAPPETTVTRPAETFRIPEPQQPPPPDPDALSSGVLVTLLSVTTSLPEPPLSAGEVVVVDDNQEVADTLVTTLRARGLSVRSFTRQKKVLDLLQRASARQTRPVVVADLFMPRLDGTGVLGGLELLETAKRLRVPPLVVLMSNHITDDARASAAELGVDAFLHKPTRWSDAEAVETFVAELSDAVLRLVRGDSEPSEPEPPSEEPAGPVTSPSVERLWREAMYELTRGATRPEILLLVLRFASENTQRAVLFRAEGDRLVGTGQFGVEASNGRDPDETVRELQLEISDHPLFERARRTGRLVVGGPGVGPGPRRLLDALGGVQPSQALAGPVFCGNELVAVVYGDGGKADRPIPDTTNLEVFLMAASMAVEKLALETELERVRGGKS